MGRRIDEMLSEADQVVRVWTANPTFIMGDVTLQVFKDLVANMRLKGTQLDETRTALVRYIAETNDKIAEVKQMVTRARSGVKAAFGPDSVQYNQVGGTRLSDRKRRSSRRAVAPISQPQ
jgi:hypothetical protein